MMKRYNFAKIFSLLLLIGLSVGITKQSFAQRVRASLALGTSAYLGDLIQGAPALKEVSPAVSIGASYDILDQLRARVNISILGAKGDDKLNSRYDYRQRNLSFTTSIWEVALLGEYDFLNSGDQAIIPYAFFGPGVYHFNPKSIDNNGNSVLLHDLGTEGQLLSNSKYADRKYSLTQLNLQFGGGVRYEVSDLFTLGFEVSFRKLFTDYLDDVSAGAYVDPAEFGAASQVYASQLSYRGDEVGFTYNEAQYRPRGNPDRKDMYYSLQLRATFRLDGIHIGRDLDFYSSGSYRAKQSTKNPKNLF